MSGVETSSANTAAHTADTPQLLLDHHLKELRLPTILREYDKVARQCAVEQVYTFWPAGKGANKVDQLLSDKLRSRALTDQTMDSVMKCLRIECLLNNISVAVPWGHAEDWQAEQMLMSRQTFTDEYLQAKAISKLTWGTDGTERSRGLLIWLIAEKVAIDAGS